MNASSLHSHSYKCMHVFNTHGFHHHMQVDGHETVETYNLETFIKCYEIQNGSDPLNQQKAQPNSKYILFYGLIPCLLHTALVFFQ